MGGALFAKGLAFGFILAATAGKLRGRLGPGLMRAINVLSGISILGFAAWQLYELFR